MSDHNPRAPLEQLRLYLANHNSLECRFCQANPMPNANGNGRKSFLPVETIIQAVDEALPLGLQKVRICGGEPFTYPHLNALLDHLEKRDLSVVIETNGSGLTAEWVARLARLPRVLVVFGWPTSDSEPLLGRSATLESIRLLSESGITPQIVVSVTRPIARKIPEIIRASEQCGAKSIRFTCPPPPVNPGSSRINGAIGPASEALTVEEAIAIGRRIERDLPKSTPLRLFFDHPPAFRGLYPQARVEGQGYCAVLNLLSILPDGTVALCPAVEAIPELTFGKLGQVPLDEIWLAQPALVSLRAHMPDGLEGICGHCLMKSACQGYCVAENYLRSGSLYGPNWFCQWADNVGLFPAGRIIENAW